MEVPSPALGAWEVSGQREAWEPAFHSQWCPEPHVRLAATL